MPKKDQGARVNKGVGMQSSIERAFQSAMRCSGAGEAAPARAEPPPAAPLGLLEAAKRRAVVAGAVALAALLVVRPPFVMCVRSDERRPWRVSSAVSWPAVSLAVLAVSAAAVVLPEDLSMKSG